MRVALEASGWVILEMAMDVSEAVSIAKRHILKLFEEENITNLGLEEAFFDPSQDFWHVTLSFSRPWENPQNALQVLTQATSSPKRSYKIVEISDKNENVISVKNYNYTM